MNSSPPRRKAAINTIERITRRPDSDERSSRPSIRPPTRAHPNSARCEGRTRRPVPPGASIASSWRSGSPTAGLSSGRLLPTDPLFHGDGGHSVTSPMLPRGIRRLLHVKFTADKSPTTNGSPLKGGKRTRTNTANSSTLRALLGSLFLGECDPPSREVHVWLR